MGVAYWGMAWLASPLPVPANTVSASLSDMPKTNPQRLLSLSAQTAAPEQAAVSESAVSQRVQLVGLMAGTPQHAGAGIALLVVDGKPAKTYRVGQAIDSELVVLSISRQGVNIGMQGATEGVTLAAQSLPPPNTGILPSVGTSADATPASFSDMPSGRSRPFARPEGMPGEDHGMLPESQR